MAETKTGIFQVKTEVGFPERIRRISGIEGPLAIGHFGLAEGDAGSRGSFGSQ